MVVGSATLAVCRIPALINGISSIFYIAKIFIGSRKPSYSYGKGTADWNEGIIEYIPCYNVSITK